MKLIKVYGCNNCPELKDSVKRAAVYFLQRLLPRKRSITVAIHLKKDLLDKKSVYGECYHMKVSPSTFKILLDRDMPMLDLITTLAHEFVHVKQFSRNELAFNLKYSRWHGKRYFDEDLIGKIAPWEIEPRAFEDSLAAEFFAQ